MMGMGGNTMGNPFMNPLAAPFLYGSMLPATQQSTGSMGMTQQQMGLMLLAGQSKQMLGAKDQRSIEWCATWRGGRGASPPAGNGHRRAGHDPAARRSGGPLFQSHVAETAYPARASTTGQISIIRKLGDENILGGFDLSERVIVPIVSLVKTDPTILCGSAVPAEASLTVNSLPWRWVRRPEVVSGCVEFLKPRRRAFGRCQNAGRKRCMGTARIVYRRAGWLALLAF